MNKNYVPCLMLTISIINIRSGDETKDANKGVKVFLYSKNIFATLHFSPEEERRLDLSVSEYVRKHPISQTMSIRQQNLGIDKLLVQAIESKLEQGEGVLYRHRKPRIKSRYCSIQ